MDGLPVLRVVAAEAVWLARIVGAAAYDLYNIPLKIAEEALRDNQPR